MNRRRSKTNSARNERLSFHASNLVLSCVQSEDGLNFKDEAYLNGDLIFYPAPTQCYFVVMIARVDGEPNLRRF
jgi:hypothetical protein